VPHHGKSLDSKFDEIHTTLRTIDNTMTSFVEKLGELNMITSSMPESIMSKIKENLATDKRKVFEHLESIESKLRHSATSLDSLQTKASGMDTQLKSIISKQEEHTDAMGSMTTLLAKFVDRVEKLEDKACFCHDLNQNQNKKSSPYYI
jgi:chromosome segregation ATPase